MSAQGEIQSLIEAAQRSYDISPSITARTDLLGREAFRGLTTLAKHIDAILEKVDGITAKASEESTNSHTEQTDLLSRATLSSLVVFAQHIDEISERVDRLWERADETTPEVSKKSNDVRAELENLRRQMKQLTKAVKKARK